ncbi:hypothetical protein R0K05_22810, partial [Planococcus sp. SIMBA_160]
IGFSPPQTVEETSYKKSIKIDPNGINNKKKLVNKSPPDVNGSEALQGLEKLLFCAKKLLKCT